MFFKSLDNTLQRLNLVLKHHLLRNLLLRFCVLRLINLKIHILLRCLQGLNTLIQRTSNRSEPSDPLAIKHLNLRNDTQEYILDASEELIVVDRKDSQLLIFLEVEELVNTAQLIERQVQLLELPETGDA